MTEAMPRITLHRLPVLIFLLGVLLPPLRAAEPTPTVPRPRLIEIQVDGLSPLLLDALMNPEDPEKLARLPDPEGFRRAIRLFQEQTGQPDLLPNLRRYFYDQGVRAENMYSATVTLSSVSWGVIRTGQPSVVKRHMTFSRNNGFMRGYLDGFRDTFEVVARRARKTSAVWELDQVGVSLFPDAFNELRRYEVPQIYYRLPPADYLKGWAAAWATAGNALSDPVEIVRGHMKRRVEGMDYPDFTEDFLGDHVADKILQPDFSGEERYDYLTVFFSIDHQHHVDPHPENLVHRMVRLDRRIGRLFRAVERSQRRDQTVVVLVSDHGSEYLPGAVNLTFPLTRMFRKRLFGGHTVTTLLTEDSLHALTTPIPGVDFPRLYEGPYSPYGRAAGPGGEEGYATATIDNFGNARAEVHLRNNDLNRLHLLLLARQRKLNEEQKAELRHRLRETVRGLWTWLEPELENYHTYHRSLGVWIPNLKQRADFYWRDVAARFEDEAARDAVQLRALDRLAELCRASDPVQWLETHDPSIPDLIPKKYLGPRNSLYQLRHYTLGLDDNLRWVETTVDPRGRSVPMDYISVLSNYEAPNPPASYEPNPVDILIRSLPVQPMQAALVARGWLSPDVALRQIIWVVSTARHNLQRGGQALVLEAGDGRLRYLPIADLQPTPDGRFEFQPHNQLDPLGLLFDHEFHSATGEPAFVWLQRFHTRQEWLRAARNTHYSIAPLVFSDLAGVNIQSSLANPDFQQTLVGFPDQQTRRDYLRGVAWKHASQQPDLLLWSSYLWNFSSKSHTAGGSHGGLTPQVARTSFLVWAGRDFGLPAGGVVAEPCTTLDIAPTLAHLLGMLDAQGRMIPQPGAVRERPFLPFPGEVLPFRQAVVRREGAHPDALPAIAAGEPAHPPSPER